MCQSRDGEVYPMSEKLVGFNYPPLHPRCRSTVAPYIEGAGRLGSRIAKVNGRSIHVPEEMKYEEFKEKYLGKALPTSADSVKLPFKWQASFSNSDQNILATNPKFTSSPAYQVNCSHCVMAWEMRMRGYDVTATGITDFDTDKVANHWWRTFKNAEVVENLNDKQEIIEKVSEWGEGARGAVYVKWSDSQLDFKYHLFTVENRNGKVIFLDPQNGELDAEYYFEEVQRGTTKLMRMDNLEARKGYIELCCKVDKDVDD